MKRFPLRRDVERLDGAKSIPASRQGDDLRKIRFPLPDGIFELLRPIQPLRRIFDARRGRGGAAEGMSRAARAEFEGIASRRQEARDLFQKTAA